MSNLDYAAKQLNKIRNRIAEAAKNAARSESEVSLIGASKMQSENLLSAFIAAGLTDLGENYLQEALDKQNQLNDNSVAWHFIGHIQSNKTKLIANHFSWVHGVDRFKIANRLAGHNQQATALKVLLQVNIDDEDSKSGIAPSAAAELCDRMAQLENLSLEGLMIIPKPQTDTQKQAKSFATARQLRDSINQRYGLSMRHLSMGMSSDLEAAIAEGSTMVRIGTDLFGARPSK